MKNLFLLYSSLFVLTGCQAVLRTALGMKRPIPQNNESVKTYAAKYFPEFDISRVDSSALNKMLRGVYKPGWSPGFRPIQFICFSPNGKIVAQWASCEGNLKSTLSSFPPHSNYLSDTTKVFSDFINMTNLLRANNEKFALNTQGYTYIIYWTVWTHRQSLNLVKDIGNYITQNNSSKSTILLVNIDNYPR